MKNTYISQSRRALRTPEIIKRVQFRTYLKDCSLFDRIIRLRFKAAKNVNLPNLLVLEQYL